jgi:mannan endo-1,4-beta-mannosidase
MRVLITVLALFALFTVNFVNGQAPASTANPNASAAARAVHEWTSNAPGVIVGQFGSYGDQTSIASANQQIADIFRRTGQRPALTGFDYHRPDKTLEQSIADANQYLTDRWNEGYLVTLSWHAWNPCNAVAKSRLEYPTPAQDGRRVLPGGDCRNAWVNALDTVAAGLQVLEDRGVVVFWRPFHEMNGAWFWWHQQPQDVFVSMWRDMFDYFTRVKGLDNLLWVYSPNTAWDRWAQRADFYYPGDAYVDWVSLDEYMEEGETELELNAFNSYNQLAAINKPFGLFEFGAIPASGAAWNTKTYCWSRLIDDLTRKYPEIRLFQAWEYVWQIGRNPYTCQRELMEHPQSITLSDLPNFRSGGVVTVPTVPPTISPTPTIWLPSPTPLATNTPRPTASPQPTATPPPACWVSVYREVTGQAAVLVERRPC